ncbi:MAG: helix-turn-helix domain-containing protein [Thermoplasmata archaeon]
MGAGPKKDVRTTRPPTVPPDREPRPPLAELPLVEVDVEAEPTSHWIRDLTDHWKLRVRMDVCRPTGPNGVDLLQVVELIGDPGDLGAAERELRHRTDLKALTVLSPSPSRRFVRAVTPLPDACRRIFEGGAICGTCRLSAPRTGGSERWTLVVPRTSDALRSVTRAGSGPRAVAAPILRMRPFVPPRTLTPRQATALETAYRLGFYAFPRRTNLSEISRILGVSRSTTAELLRRAESKMLSEQLSPA